MAEKQDKDFVATRYAAVGARAEIGSGAPKEPPQVIGDLGMPLHSLNYAIVLNSFVLI